MIVTTLLLQELITNENENRFVYYNPDLHHFYVYAHNRKGEEEGSGLISTPSIWDCQKIYKALIRQRLSPMHLPLGDCINLNGKGDLYEKSKSFDMSFIFMELSARAVFQAFKNWISENGITFRWDDVTVIRIGEEADEGVNV